MRLGITEILLILVLELPWFSLLLSLPAMIRFRAEPSGPEKLEMVQSRAEARQEQQVRAEQRQEQLVRLVQKLGRLEMLHRVRLEYPVRVERRPEQLVRLA